MKKLGLIGVIVLLGICVSAAGAFAEVKTIQNQAFAILQSRSGDVYLHIRNDDCTATYRAVVNETVLGEGTLDVGVSEIVIPFGDANLYLRCSGGEMTVRLR